MGLIKAIAGAAGGVMADQWKEYFYCEAMPANILVKCSPSQGHFHLTHSGSIPAGYSPVVM